MRLSKKVLSVVVAFLEGKSPAEQKWQLPEAGNQGQQVELRETSVGWVWFWCFISVGELRALQFLSFPIDPHKASVVCTNTFAHLHGDQSLKLFKKIPTD